MTDQLQLCRRAQQGDQPAAEELILLHYKRIYAFLQGLCRNEADAADLTQKTFCRFCEKIESFAGKSSVSTWIHGIAYHVYREWRRTSHRLQHQPVEWWEGCIAEGNSPFSDLAEKETALRLYLLVEKLDEDTRPVIHLHYYQGLSLNETAEVLDISASAVKYRLRNGLAYLKSSLKEPANPRT